MIENPSDTYLIIGDFNMSGIIWNPLNDSLAPTNISSGDEYMLTDELQTLALDQYNGILNTFGKILDLVLCNEKVVVEKCLDPLTPVDDYHPALIININFAVSSFLTPAPYTRYLFDKGNFTAINNELSAIDWLTEFDSRSLDDALSYFYSIISDLQHRLIPTKRINHSTYPIWYCSSLKRLIRQKYKCLVRFKLYGRISDEAEFKLLRERVKELESDCYKRYLDSTEASISNNPKRFWGFVKHRSKSNVLPSYFKHGDSNVSSPDSICNAFSTHFYSTFLNPINEVVSNSTLSHSNSVTSSDIHLIDINVEIVQRLLAKLDPFKSAGPDHLSPKFLIKCAKTLALPISLLFKKSLSACVVPQIWKSAFITPVHKKGPKTDIVNYRPISKLCVLVKVFERLVYDQVYAALKNSFSPSQHGFLKGRSPTTNLLLLTDLITDSMSSNAQVDVVYTDYSKAFDRIDHNILKLKLFNSGIRGDLLRWFSSYLENRSQAVVISNYMSSWVKIPSGVPQGSLMGPLLFVIYVNDINSCFHTSHLLCFADDMKIFSSVSSFADADNLQSDLSRLDQYCSLNKLDLNPLKCSVVTYSRKRLPLPTSYKLKNQIVPRSNVVRDLGVHYDSKLLFNVHIDEIVAKASKALGFIMRVSGCFKQAKTFKILYCTYVRSHLEYASQIWNPYYSKYIDRLENIQKRFVKFLCFRLRIPYRSDNYVSLCKKFHLQPLFNRRQIADCTFLLKLISNEIDCPELLNKLYFNIPYKLVRYNPPLYIPPTSSNYRQNSYFIRASKDFNKQCKDLSFDPFTINSLKLRKLLNLNFFD